MKKKNAVPIEELNLVRVYLSEFGGYMLYYFIVL